MFLMINIFHITNYNPHLSESSPTAHAQKHQTHAYNMLISQPKKALFKDRTPSSIIDLSNPGITLQVHLSRRIRIPSLANILKNLGIRHADRNIALTLHELHSETLRCVPRDVAMQEPRARVVFLEGDGEVAVCGEGGDVAARWVDEV
jgi:hypothetical protein